MNRTRQKIKSIFLIVLACFLFFSPSLTASAEILFGESYYQRLRQHFAEAEESITVAMYFIIITPDDESNPVNILVEELIEAAEREVEVKVILESSKLRESRLAYEKLRDSGVEVYFDTPEHLLHIKGVAVDGRFIFIGSANWSKAAMERNYEATFFKESPEDALAFVDYVESIPVQEGDLLLPISEGVGISADFLLKPEQGRQLVKDQAYGQLDLYLLLCKKQPETDKSYLKIDYEKLAQKMGYRAPDDLGGYRSEHDYFYERIHHLLVPLRERGLIAYRRGRVTLKTGELGGSDKPAIIIPFAYWEAGYAEELSMRAKYMYLICLYEAGRSSRYPSWFRSQKDMSEIYGLSEPTISLGLQELEEEGLIEITRDRPTPPDFADRKANIYRLLPLVGN
jgi:DNA-binding transcriptional ArsR family regulator/HKD family nuclease